MVTEAMNNEICLGSDSSSVSKCHKKRSPSDLQVC